MTGRDTPARWSFEDQAHREWTVVVVSAITTLAGLATFAALWLN